MRPPPGFAGGHSPRGRCRACRGVRGLGRWLGAAGIVPAAGAAKRRSGAGGRGARRDGTVLGAGHRQRRDPGGDGPRQYLVSRRQPAGPGRHAVRPRPAPQDRAVPRHGGRRRGKSTASEPRLSAAGPGQDRRAMRQLARNSMIELALGLVVFGLVGVLGTLPPGLHERRSGRFRCA